jgi:hypothetical protein
MYLLIQVKAYNMSTESIWAMVQQVKNNIRDNCTLFKDVDKEGNLYVYNKLYAPKATPIEVMFNELSQLLVQQIETSATLCILVADAYDANIGTPPSPLTGATYLSTSNAVVVSWKKDYLYRWNGATWDEIIPSAGMMILVLDTITLAVYSGTRWITIISADDTSKDYPMLDSADWPPALADTIRIFASTDGRLLKRLPNGDVEELVSTD